LLTWRVVTSSAFPSRIAPLGDSDKVLSLVVPLGLTKNKTLLAAAEPSTTALYKLSKERKSPIYSSINPLPQSSLSIEVYLKGIKGDLSKG